MINHHKSITIIITIEKILFYLLFNFIIWFSSLFFLYFYLEEKFNSKLLISTNNFQKKIESLSSELEALQISYEKLQKSKELVSNLSFDLIAPAPLNVVPFHGFSFQAFSPLFNISLLGILTAIIVSAVYFKYILIAKIGVDTLRYSILYMCAEPYISKVLVPEYTFVDSLRNTFKIKFNSLDHTCTIFLKSVDSKDFVPLIDAFSLEPQVFNKDALIKSITQKISEIPPNSGVSNIVTNEVSTNTFTDKAIHTISTGPDASIVEISPFMDPILDVINTFWT